MDEKVKKIADAIQCEREQILNDLKDCMKGEGVVFIDRQFVEEWLDRFE